MQKQKNSLLRNRTNLLKELRSISSLLDGSLVKTYKKCGNPSCKCAKGMLHPTYLLTWKEQGKTKTFYVSKHMLHEVEKAWNSYIRLKQIIKDLSGIQRELFKLEGKEHGTGKKQQS